MSAEDALFAVPEGYEPAVAAQAPELTRGQKRQRCVDNRIMAGIHPLGYVPLHSDAPRSRDGDGPRCGTCRFRESQRHHDKTYPKCFKGDGIRVTGGESSDIRAWWPACRDYEEASA